MRSNHQTTDLDDPTHDEFERLGRLAGAELRTPAPDDGESLAQTAANRRKTATTATGTVVVILAVAFLVAGLLTISRRNDSPVVDTPIVPPTVPPTTSVGPATTGQWRPIDTTSLSPRLALGAVWTGTEAIVLGSLDQSAVSDPQLVAVAYDVEADRWRRLPAPPEIGLDDLAGMRWTGGQVLLVSRRGDVHIYDPDDDRWRTGSSATSPIADDIVVGVSADGALLHDGDGWQWYDAETDRWTNVPAPDRSTAEPYTSIADLGDGRMVAANASIAYSVFDVETRTWEDEVAVAGPPDPRGMSFCASADSRLVCYAEGFASLDGVVVDPDTTSTQTFELGNHASSINFQNVPWFTHAWRLLDPTTARWEELPPLTGADSFDAAVWTGTELVMFAGSDAATGARSGTAAAYAPTSRIG